MNHRETVKSAFVTHHGLSKYTRSPFGLKNGPATFQRAIKVIFFSAKRQRTTVNVYNTTIFSKTLDEYLKHNHEALLLPKTAKMFIELNKCFFSSKPIDLLGFLFAPNCLQVAKETTEAIKMLQYPANVSRLRSFPSLWNLYCWFVPIVVRLALPLVTKLKKRRLYSLSSMKRRKTQ